MSRQFGALSGIAMALIVLNHAIQLGMEAPIRSGYPAVSGYAMSVLAFLQALGVFAVPTFLFISGGFVAYAAQGDPPRLTSKFLINSLRHILIPYVIWSILFYILIALHQGRTFTITQYIKHLLVGYPFHFIPLLAIYYLFSPLLVTFARRYPIYLIVVFLLTQLFVINIHYDGILGFQPPEVLRIFAPPVIGQTYADWGIFFPLGLVYGLKARQLQPALQKYHWIFVIATIIFFILASLTYRRIIDFEISRHLSTLTFVLLIPAIKRDRIPFVRSLERFGRRSYGIYLTHLIIIDVFVWIFESVFPVVLVYQIILITILLAAGIILPVAIIEASASGWFKKHHRLVFG
jgi:peptidoglycan/LPS O-acetylase OafA/YrhL